MMQLSDTLKILNLQPFYYGYPKVQESPFPALLHTPNTIAMNHQKEMDYRRLT
jgi:hypothetical protein